MSICYSHDGRVTVTSWHQHSSCVHYFVFYYNDELSRVMICVGSGFIQDARVNHYHSIYSDDSLVPDLAGGSLFQGKLSLCEKIRNKTQGNMGSAFLCALLCARTGHCIVRKGQTRQQGTRTASG